MDDLAREVNSYFFVDLPVLDRTGLCGTYDIRMEATPEFRLRGEPQAGDIDVFSAVGKLGLKLAKDRASVEVLVVDRFERPSEN